MNTSDPFETLGLEARFDLDDAALHRRFIERSAATHPDRFSDPLEQADAADRAAAINEAYRLLKNPESRANVLLTRLGGPDKSDDKTLPPDLLMQMMQVREELEQAQADGNAAELARLRDWAARQRQSHLVRVGELLDKAAALPDDQRTDGLQQVRIELNALRYIERMIEQMPQISGE